MGLRIGRLLIFATDIEEAARFYGDVLEMDSLGQPSRRASFAGDGFVLDAFKCEAGGDWESDALHAGSSFDVESIDNAISELEARGVVFIHSEPAVNEPGRNLAFRDPFGVVHELFEPHAG